MPVSLFPSVQAAMTKYHRLQNLNNRHLFLTVLEAGKSKIKVPADPVPGLEKAALLLSSHMQRRVSKAVAY
jgi:hypothetical protein